MADTDIGWAHAEAIAALLEPLPYPVHMGEVTDDDALVLPYVVLWPPPASRQTVTLNGYGGEATTTTQVTASGRDVREVITCLDRVSAALHRQRPTIAGRRCGLITQVPGAAGPPQPERDEQVRTESGRPIFFSFHQFTLYSTNRSP